jgi:hypothetical protein
MEEDAPNARHHERRTVSGIDWRALSTSAKVEQAGPALGSAEHPQAGSGDDAAMAARLAQPIPRRPCARQRLASAAELRGVAPEGACGAVKGFLDGPSPATAFRHVGEFDLVTCLGIPAHECDVVLHEALQAFDVWRWPGLRHPTLAE